VDGEGGLKGVKVISVRVVSSGGGVAVEMKQKK
jgi:hypothetical protein